MQGGLQCTQQQVGTGLQGFGRSRGGLHCTTPGGDRHAGRRGSMQGGGGGAFIAPQQVGTGMLGGVFNAPHKVRAGMQACGP